MKWLEHNEIWTANEFTMFCYHFHITLTFLFVLFATSSWRTSLNVTLFIVTLEQFASEERFFHNILFCVCKVCVSLNSCYHFNYFTHGAHANIVIEWYCGNDVVKFAVIIYRIFMSLCMPHDPCGKTGSTRRTCFSHEKLVAIV